ncbi:MAG TPA: flagellar biosynthetic protein FliR [Candidatus Sulfotelmatobacter sp.]|nr:flagellar biosynthetic protein FliR [Candidatus Sulfotelmatobacter sp.]
MDSFRLETLILAAVFVGVRVAGLMVFCPFLGSDAIPTRLKAVLALLLTALLFSVRGPAHMELQGWQWVGVSLSECVIGLVLGLTANFMMEAPMMAGQVLGVQMGYSLATLFDPQTQADTPVLGEFHRLAALLIFLQFNVHHWLLRAITKSFDYLPPGAAPVTYAAVTGVLHAAAAICLTGLQIAAPGLVATLVADVALGFLGKASPQLPVLFVGLAIKNLVGLAVLATLVTFWPQSFSQKFAESIAVGERLLHLSH